jgi:hypothetical protein
MKTIHNIETGEIIERELNAEELAQQAIDEVAFAEKEAEKEAEANAKAAAKASAEAKLAALGLTPEEIAALR